jgi:hypothetical protein
MKVGLSSIVGGRKTNEDAEFAVQLKFENL